ncbi:MAG: hypothetical protein HZA31_14065 [Opitutae bacterium]|nr:hypothetical protein [Opitutae bacterium]
MKTLLVTLFMIGGIAAALLAFLLFRERQKTPMLAAELNTVKAAAQLELSASSAPKRADQTKPASAQPSERRAAGQPLLAGKRLRQVLAELQEKGLARIPKLVTMDGRLLPDLDKVCATSEAERQQLQVLLTAMQSRMQNAAATLATVDRLEDGSLRLSVPPILGAAQLSEEFSQAVTNVLGADRASVFKEAAWPQVAASVGGFGVDPMTITIKPRPSGRGPQAPTTYVVNESRGPEGAKPARRFTQVDSIAQIKRIYGPLADRVIHQLPEK